MTQHKQLLHVLDEGLAFEQWIEDGHTEECFEAADHMHRVVAARLDGTLYDEALAPAAAVLDACPLCRADLEDALALTREAEAESSAPAAAIAAEPQPKPTLPERGTSGDRPVAAADARSVTSVTDRRVTHRLAYGLAAALVVVIAGVTLAILLMSNPRPDPHRTKARPAVTRAVLPMTRARPAAKHTVVRTETRPAVARTRARTRPVTSRTVVRAKSPMKPRRRPRGRKYGILRINTVPWTKIYIDGRYKGKTPQLKLRLLVGRRKLVLINDQERVRKTFFITIREDRPTTFIRRFRRR